jgi:Nitroreductase family
LNIASWTRRRVAWSRLVGNDLALPYLENNVSSARTVVDARATAHALLSLRNRDDALPPPEQWNEVLATILSHRSVRGFLPDELPDGTLEMLIAAAQSASTSSNLQFWSVVAVQEPERKSRLAELAGQQQFIRDAPLLLLWLADLSRLGRIAAEHQAQVDGTHYL